MDCARAGHCRPVGSRTKLASRPSPSRVIDSSVPATTRIALTRRLLIKFDAYARIGVAGHAVRARVADRYVRVAT